MHDVIILADSLSTGSWDALTPPPSLQGPGIRGQDYLGLAQLELFCEDGAVPAAVWKLSRCGLVQACAVVM
jgi:hypothetical protein